ncbi:hypothetical protein ADL22_16305 [Streptomyces sp. NRRL F-4489]|uniref:hypothetical protein n=1 Tax=Streptomyces sp. NRRL F-4489 TaxID=1609095 RepID=UPI000749AC16|nr:hypothetical protein [Streptomyces sp. NRRL F-4489]KUL38831.1 hypothetical protein ADL22_16305 [Streptomyces sp. NRRL F-4489]
MSVPEQPTSSPPDTGRRFRRAASADEARPRSARSEATRLLCAGVYFDAQFRTGVIQELVEHAERPIAPSQGFDALPVLAHALRARRREAETGLILLAIWAVFIVLGMAGVGSVTPLPFPWWLAYGVVCAVSWFARGTRSSPFALGRSVLKEATRGRLKAVLPVLPFVAAVFYWGAVLYTLFLGVPAWAAVVFPLLMVVPVWAHRMHVVGVMRHQLSREAFATARQPELPAAGPYPRIGAAIAREQHAPLVIYDPFRPFVGAGEPYKPWSVAMELKRKDWSADDAEAGAEGPPRPKVPFGKRESAPAPLTGREVVELIKPRLEALRTSAAATSRDRLRSLEVDELVYLPVGLPRDDVDYSDEVVQEHLERAVGEGAEARRHFLRVRVGAWDEQVAICLLVRIHTQGGMLVLEVVPHVLTPVRPEFKSVDVLAAQEWDDRPRDAIRALLTSPSAGVAAGISLCRTAVSVFRTWLAMPEYALPDAPMRSVRQLGSVKELSLFQEMDLTRYVKTLQDRIANGVQEALHSKGYETGVFDQYIINVGEGGVFIGGMSGGAVAAGERASAKHLDGKKETGGGRG